ncbi:hypothetical protein PFISCL1PPCAC_2149 [Pristionchus fissidentatus]|uniref:ribonuclease H n=1 Tax=Pristionchus fissidentatus TaxID=1538716 RepID=A0AAV5UUC4_9BILA|nr:hypothetical protein PFISCL1PPCAC_2149 [Pristionchus fissidentatus]
MYYHPLYQCLMPMPVPTIQIPPISVPPPPPPPTIIVYTDASCTKVNGKGVASGIGLYFGHNHPLNTSKRLGGSRHDSGVAEIIAVQTALKKIHEWSGYQNHSVVVRTDYMGIIDAMIDGNDGRFTKLYADLRRAAEKFTSGVSFEYVASHDGDHGNEMADQLARQAIHLGPSKKSRRGGHSSHSRAAHVKGRRSAIARRSGVGVSDTKSVPSPVPNRRKINKRRRKQNQYH